MYEKGRAMIVSYSLENGKCMSFINLICACRSNDLQNVKTIYILLQMNRFEMINNIHDCFYPLMSDVSLTRTFLVRDITLVVDKTILLYTHVILQ